MINKLKFLKFTLQLGVIYYVVGAIAHYFSLTLFPFFVKSLYTPYQDSVIALCALIFSIILYTIAKDPVKNMDMLRIVIICAFIGSIFSVLIIYKVDFVAIGSPEKKLQTIVEGIMGFIWVGALFWSLPERTN